MSQAKRINGQDKKQVGFVDSSRPNVKGIIGNAKLVGGYIEHNSNHEKIFNFITPKGTFSYNEATDEFKKKLMQHMNTLSLFTVTPKVVIRWKSSHLMSSSCLR